MSAGLGVVAAAGILHRNELLDLCFSRSPAEDFLVNFPDSYPGVREIHKFRHRGSQHCLVHIQQQHIRLDVSDRAFQGAKISQQSIKQVLAAFRADERIKLKELFTEGVTGPDSVSGERITEKLFSYVGQPTEKNRLELQSLIQSLDPKAGTLTLKLLKDLPRIENWIRMRGIISAPLELEREGLSILPGEDMTVLQKFTQDPMGAAATEARNTALLQKIVDRGDEVAFTIFGTAHRFNETIKRWNEAHPEHRFSLIEVLPEGTAEALESGLY